MSETVALQAATLDPFTLQHFPASFQQQALAARDPNMTPMRLTASQTHVTCVNLADGEHLVPVPSDLELSPEKAALRSKLHELEQYICFVENQAEGAIVRNRAACESQAYVALRVQQAKFENVAQSAIAEARDVVSNATVCIWP